MFVASGKMRGGEELFTIYQFVTHALLGLKLGREPVGYRL